MQWDNDTVLTPVTSVDLACLADNGRKKESVKTSGRLLCLTSLISVWNWEQKKQRTLHAGLRLPSLPSAVVAYLMEKSNHFSQHIMMPKVPQKSMFRVLVLLRRLDPSNHPWTTWCFGWCGEDSGLQQRESRKKKLGGNQSMRSHSLSLTCFSFLFFFFFLRHWTK